MGALRGMEDLRGMGGGAEEGIMLCLMVRDLL